jgi:hypothetical protein
MSNPTPEPDATCLSGKAEFRTTHWSVILAASQQEKIEHAKPWSFCAGRTGIHFTLLSGVEDMNQRTPKTTQAFFSRLLSKEYLRAIDPRKGKFRSFLLAALEHFLANEWRRSKTQKRGGGFSFISIESVSAEQNYYNDACFFRPCGQETRFWKNRKTTDALHRNGQIGTHYAGPTWESRSGSKVVAARLAGCTPDTTAIPWLKLGAVSSQAPGLFGNVTFIQRVNTIGGLAPSTAGTTIGQLANVPYTADYYFYSPAK